MYLFWMIYSYMVWHTAASAEHPPGVMYLSEKAPHYFKYFVAKFNKIYASENEKDFASLIFKRNLEHVNRLNRDSEHATYGITKFMDMTVDDFFNKVKCLTRNLTSDTSKCQVLRDEDIPDDGNAPEALDWRKKKVVTSVKDQGHCRCCYAFSAVGQLEAQNALIYEQLVDLSAQQIVDCDPESFKCKGGYMTAAFRSLMDQRGSMRSRDYPYQEKPRKCRANPNRALVKVASCSTYRLKSQEKLKQLLYNHGPIAVGVIGAEGLSFYQKGIITDNQCRGSEINHAVLLVGYGEENGIPYWICKNSLGSNWGEGGYFRMQRGETRHSCGMLNDYMATATIE